MKSAQVALAAVMWMGGTVVQGAGAEPRPARSAVTGTVRFDGPAPPPTRRAVTVDRKACGPDSRPDRSLVVDSSSRGIRGTVVTLEGGAGVLPPAAASFARIEQARCEFFPYLSVVAPGANVEVVNVDELMHAVRTAGEPRGHRVLPVDATLVVPAYEPGHVHLVCDLHYWSSAWVVTTPAPFVAVTGSTGAFAFRNVPAGEWTLRVWHERFEEQTRTLSLGTSGSLVENVLFAPALPGR